MHEVIIQVCFVIAGLVNACTTGVVYTDHPTLVESVAPVVYVDNAPQRVISYYSLFSVPVPVVEYRRTYRTRGIYTHALHQRRHVHRHYHRTHKTVHPHSYHKPAHRYKSTHPHKAAHHHKSKVTVHKPKMKKKHLKKGHLKRSKKSTKRSHKKRRR